MILVCYNVFGLFVRHLSWSVEGGLRYRNTLYKTPINDIDHLKQKIRETVVSLTPGRPDCGPPLPIPSVVRSDALCGRTANK